MDPYALVMLVVGSMALAGIFLTWHLTWLVERYRLGNEKLSWLILAGGLLTAVGFLGHQFWVSIEFLIVLGSALIIYALSMSGLVGAKLEMLAQIGPMVASIGFSNDLGNQTVLIFSDVSLLLLMDAVAFYSHSPPKPASMARLSAWLLVGFTIVKALSYRSLPALLLYTASVSLWITSLLLLYPSAKVLNSAQEGL